MDEESATERLVAAAVTALRAVPGLSGASDGAPMQAGDAHATVEAGPETDWGHKSGAGAEVRFAVLIRCGGESPSRARALSGMARGVLAELGPELGPSTGSGHGRWRLVSLLLLRARTVPLGRGEDKKGPGRGWTGLLEYRARLLRD